MSAVNEACATCQHIAFTMLSPPHCGECHKKAPIALLTGSTGGARAVQWPTCNLSTDWCNEHKLATPPRVLLESIDPESIKWDKDQLITVYGINFPTEEGYKMSWNVVSPDTQQGWGGWPTVDGESEAHFNISAKWFAKGTMYLCMYVDNVASNYLPIAVQ